MTVVAVAFLAGAAMVTASVLTVGQRLPRRRARLGPAAQLTTLAGVVLVTWRAVDLGGITGLGVADALTEAAWVGTVTVSCLVLSRSASRLGRMSLFSAAVVTVLALRNDQVAAAAAGAAVAGAGAALWALGVPRPAMLLRAGIGVLIGLGLATGAASGTPTQGSPGWRLVVMTLPLATLLADGTVTAWRRVRTGRALLDVGRDTLVARLASAGVPRGAARTAVEAVHVACGLVALAVSTGEIGVPIGAAATGIATLVLLAVAQSARLGGPRQWAPLGILGVVVVALVAASAIAGLAALSARSAVLAGAAQAQAGIGAASGGDVDSARQRFAEAESSFSDAADVLHHPVVALGLPVPIIGANLHVTRTLVADGRSLAALGTTLVEAEDAESLRVIDGRLPVESVAPVAADLDLAATALSGAVGHVESGRRRDLFGPLRSALARFEAPLAGAAHDAARAAAAARVIPGLVGGGVPKRYFLAVQNNAESRATGGFIGNFGEVTAVDGRLELARFGRISELNPTEGSATRVLEGPPDYESRYARFDPESAWQNVNVSPDLGAVAEVIADLYPQSGGEPVDGVVVIDPIGLAALLGLTGPVTVAPWPEPIGAENVVDVMLKDAYARFPQETRVQFLGDVADAVIRRVTTGTLGSPVQIVERLAPAVSGGHLRFTTLDADADRVLASLGISGRILPSPVDSLLLTTQNAAANKLDVYLRRRVSYDIELRPGDDGAAGVEATVAIDLRNDLPDAPLPASVTGPYDARFVAGQNRTFLSLYTPLSLRTARLDGRTVGLEPGEELGRRVYSTFLDLQAEQERRLEVELTGALTLEDGGWYDLDLLHQALLLPDDVTVRVSVPPGWSITATEGARRSGARAASTRVTLDRDAGMRVRVVRDQPQMRWWDRLFGPLP